MSAEDSKKEQCRLMSDVSHSGEESGDDAILYLPEEEEEDGGLCKNILRSRTGRLAAMLILIIGYFFAEVVVGHITNSLTLVADSFHMLSDALSLIVGLVAVRMSRRTAKDPFRPWPSKEPYFNTFGWVRFEILGALINSTFLLALCISIFLEAIEKFTDPKLVDSPKLVLAVGGGGLIINIFGLVMFGSHSHGGHDHGHGHSHVKRKRSHSGEVDAEHEGTNGDVALVEGGESRQKKVAEMENHLNMRAVFLHVLGDALGSVIVMISASVIWLVPHENNDWIKFIDPAMSLLLVCIMVFTTVPLFKQSSMILLQTVPKHIKLDTIRNKLKKIPGIQAIHDLHIWQLSGEKIVATVHVQCANAETYLKLVQKIKESLHHEGIHSLTVQPEFSFSEAEQSPFCQLVCGESCISKTCCPQDNPKSDKSKVQANGQSAAAAAVPDQQTSYVTSNAVPELAPTETDATTTALEALPNAVPSATLLVGPVGAKPRPRSVENPTVPDHQTRSTWSVPDAAAASMITVVDIVAKPEAPNTDEDGAV